MRKVFLLVIFQILILAHGVKKSKYIHPIDDKEYRILRKLTLGTFNKPVKERSTIAKSTIDRFWRAKGKFSVEDSKLFNDGER